MGGRAGPNKLRPWAQHEIQHEYESQRRIQDLDFDPFEICGVLTKEPQTMRLIFL